MTILFTPNLWEGRYTSMIGNFRLLFNLFLGIYIDDEDQNEAQQYKMWIKSLGKSNNIKIQRKVMWDFSLIDFSLFFLHPHMLDL